MISLTDRLKVETEEERGVSVYAVIVEEGDEFDFEYLSSRGLFNFPEVIGVQETAGYTGLERRRELRAREVNLQDAPVYLVIKVL